LGWRRSGFKLFSALTLMLPLLKNRETLFEEKKSSLQMYDSHAAQRLFIIVAKLLPGRRRSRRSSLVSAALFFPLQIGDRRPIAERRPAHLASFFRALGALGASNRRSDEQHDDPKAMCIEKCRSLADFTASVRRRRLSN
jgi:hypothetical protein